MNTGSTRAPHRGGPQPVHSAAPNAALLIDFDNVTMGIRSDLSRELRALFNSEIIRGKVAVQRAYADWRRYPQYIVPLSESSIDLIFAPAVGSSKKNATDIRLALDALELVFTRPEIGTFILLSGDSDFSSLVIKLKEYGKYVVGVGIRESTSDMLIQNCDEYYSYAALTGLKRETDEERVRIDPWVLVEKSLDLMVERKDVMRSDRLKQVMIELDNGFAEREYGYSKFSKFLTDAAGRGLIKLRKLENGQYEIHAPGEAPAAGRAEREKPAPSPSAEGEKPASAEPEREARRVSDDPLRDAYALLRRAVASLTAEGVTSVRDSDVKRSMLELDPHFEEAELGFGKFSRFLRQAHDAEVIDLRKTESGNYEVATREARPEAAAIETAAPSPALAAPVPHERIVVSEPVVGEPGVGLTFSGPTEGGRIHPAVSDAIPTPSPRGLRFRRGARGRPRPGETPSVQSGQAVGDATPGAPAVRGRRPAASAGSGDESERLPATAQPATGQSRGTVATANSDELARLGLPTDSGAIVRYLTNRYRGVGRKTAEALVERFGPDVFRVLHREPSRVQELLPENRADTLLGAWRADYERRTGQESREPSAPPRAAESAPVRAGARGGRRGGRAGHRPSAPEPPADAS